jgi:hypothetical protein
MHGVQQVRDVDARSGYEMTAVIRGNWSCIEARWSAVARALFDEIDNAALTRLLAREAGARFATHRGSSSGLT